LEPVNSCPRSGAIQKCHTPIRASLRRYKITHRAIPTSHTIIKSRHLVDAAGDVQTVVNNCKPTAYAT
ncbi:MAG: hypothetical protein SGPRY_005303, partial [Prymnesium sp.]